MNVRFSEAAARRRSVSKVVTCCLLAGAFGLAANRLFAASENPPPSGCVYDPSSYSCEDHCPTQPHTCENDIDGGCTPC